MSSSGPRDNLSGGVSTLYIYIIPIFCQGDGLRTIADRRLRSSSLAWAGAVVPRYGHTYRNIYTHTHMREVFCCAQEFGQGTPDVHLAHYLVRCV